MARLARAELFDPSEIAIVHTISRVVRRCYLFGDDPVTGKNFDHRKVWIEERLKTLATYFGIDLLSFSLLSNSFHLILRSRPDVVKNWSSMEAAYHWLKLCPGRKKKKGVDQEPTEAELNAICKNVKRLEQIRTRLSDIGWWMRLLCQNIAVRANKEDGEVGKFFQSRYRSVRLCDEEALTACSVYVDLSSIRAGISKTIEESDNTSAQRRIQGLSNTDRIEPSDCKDTRHLRPDGFLSPLSIDELREATSSTPSKTGVRCSDKGFLSISSIEYIELLDWTARQIVPGKSGSTPESAPEILKRLSLHPENWVSLVTNFGELFYNVAGRPTVVDSMRSRLNLRRFHLRREARKVLQAGE